MTTSGALRDAAERATALERVGATLIAVEEPGLAPALRLLPARGIQSLVVEGGAVVHCAAWDENLIDYVQLYVAPVWIGPRGVPLLEGRTFMSTALLERKIELLGPDVLIEGYVHRPD